MGDIGQVSFRLRVDITTLLYLMACLMSPSPLVNLAESRVSRSPRMALHTRVALIDTLLEEADQKMQALHHALAAQERAKKAIQHAGHDTPLSQEEATLKYE